MSVKSGAGDSLDAARGARRAHEEFFEGAKAGSSGTFVAMVPVLSSPLSAWSARARSVAAFGLRAAVLIPLIAGCGSSPPPPAAPPSDASKEAAKPDPKKAAEAEAAAQAASDKTVPTTCTPDANGLCAPPVAFVKHLCAGSYPDVALAMFGKGTPWTRGYLRRTMEAWNASGGASSNEKVELDEEVLLLVHRAPDTGGMSVSGATGSYEALRWDGTCVSLTSEEVTTKLPPKAKYAKIPWKVLDVKTRDALAADEKVGAVVTDYRKECKGASFGEVSLKCVKADQKLSVVIVDYIRGGGTVPVPASLP